MKPLSIGGHCGPDEKGEDGGYRCLAPAGDRRVDAVSRRPEHCGPYLVRRGNDTLEPRRHMPDLEPLEKAVDDRDRILPKRVSVCDDVAEPHQLEDVA